MKAYAAIEGGVMATQVTADIKLQVRDELYAWEIVLKGGHRLRSNRFFKHKQTAFRNAASFLKINGVDVGALARD